MVDALISIVKDKLVGLVEEELKLLGCTREAVDKLSVTQTVIQSYLRDVEVRQYFKGTENPNAEDWLKKLKYAAYEVDDVLDEWETAKSQQLSIDSNRVWNSVMQLFRKTSLNHRVGNKIKEINDQLDHIFSLVKKLGFLKSASDQTTAIFGGANFPSVIRTARETTSLEEKMFGREEEINSIKHKLINRTSCSEASELAVVAIVGLAGIGKTAIARSVFNDSEIVQHFNKRIWVCVSDEFDEASITRNIIEDATEKDPPAGGKLQALQKQIVEVLKNKLFLLVLDDVWNEVSEKWDKLFNVIQNCGLSGSRIVVTTRSENVCKVMQAGHNMFQVGILPFKSCWDIFESVAFGTKNKSKSPGLEKVGEEIVKKCKGVPLAIKTVAGVLRTETTIKDWEYVLKSDMWEWNPKSGILPALLLSYYHLSAELKQCFQYCAIYPKDYNISKVEIVRQWIAHGYILENKKMEMEDVGEKYFDELVARSLFQEPELDNYNNITQCKMHDLVHDLARLVTNGEFLHEENINEFDAQYRLHCNVSNVDKIDVGKFLKLRTLISTSYEREVYIGDRQIEKMRHLRVLDLKNWRRHALPDVVGKLMHLRYLKLCKGEFKAIPRSIGELQNLLYLDLSKTHIEALSKSVGMLRKLRHLNLSYNENLKALPSTIGRLTNLRKLDLKITGLDEIPDFIGKLASLQVLDISYNDLEKLPESIKDLSTLQVLDVKGCQKLEHLPAGLFDKMTGLKQLSILDSGLRGLPTGIGKLTCLQSLDRFWVAGNHDGSSSSSSSNIWELGDLDHLHGFLRINNLDMVTSGKEAGRARLHNKNSLTHLYLAWNTDGRGGAKEKTSEVVLQALRPCPTLADLYIEGYPGCTVPTWLGNSTALMLSGLQDLRLLNWNGCNNLPALGNLPELQHLYIMRMPKVRRVGAEWFGSNHAFPKLEYLLFRDMAEWEEWDILEEKLFFPFPCLSKLKISDCPKLRSLPPIFSTSPLREIHVHKCPNLEEMSFFPCLSKLEISHCPKLRSLPPTFSTSPLQEIHVDECPNLEEKSFFPCLSKLEIWNCPKLQSLPSLPNLEHLTIDGNDGVSELSNDLVNKLGALKTLEIRNCPNLESLPQEMASLKQLQELEIWNCPKLKESCSKEGAQWYKIQHIPHIRMPKY